MSDGPSFSAVEAYAKGKEREKEEESESGSGSPEPSGFVPMSEKAIVETAGTRTAPKFAPAFMVLKPGERWNPVEHCPRLSENKDRCESQEFRGCTWVPFREACMSKSGALALGYLWDKSPAKRELQIADSVRVRTTTGFQYVTKAAFERFGQLLYEPLMGLFEPLRQNRPKDGWSVPKIVTTVILGGAYAAMEWAGVSGVTSADWSLWDKYTAAESFDSELLSGFFNSAMTVQTVGAISKNLFKLGASFLLVAVAKSLIRKIFFQVNSLLRDTMLFLAPKWEDIHFYVSIMSFITTTILIGVALVSMAPWIGIAGAADMFANPIAAAGTIMSIFQMMWSIIRDEFKLEAPSWFEWSSFLSNIGKVTQTWSLDKANSLGGIVYRFVAWIVSRLTGTRI